MILSTHVDKNWPGIGEKSEMKNEGKNLKENFKKILFYANFDIFYLVFADFGDLKKFFIFKYCCFYGFAHLLQIPARVLYLIFFVRIHFCKLRQMF